MLNVTDWTAVGEQYPTLSEDEVAKYLAQDPSILCTVSNFRIDFHRPWKKFSFNKDARRVFIDKYFARVQGGAFSTKPTPPHLLTPEVIGEILDKHMNYCRERWRNSLKPVDEEVKTKRARRAAQRSRQNTVRYGVFA